MVIAAFVAATVWLTSYFLALLPAAPRGDGAAEEVGFLAHLLIPLSAALFLVVVVTIFAAAYRVVLAFRGSSPSRGEPPEDPLS